MSQIIYADPVLRHIERVRAAAAILRVDGRDDGRANLLERYADDLEEAVRVGSDAEWVDSKAVAVFDGVSLAAVQARCRRRLQREGLARKRIGGQWEIKVSVIERAA